MTLLIVSAGLHTGDSLKAFLGADRFSELVESLAASWSFRRGNDLFGSLSR